MRHCYLLALDALQMFDDDDDDDDDDECIVLVAAAAKSSSSDDYRVKQFIVFSKNQSVCGKHDMGKYALELVICYNFINQSVRPTL